MARCRTCATPTALAALLLLGGCGAEEPRADTGLDLDPAVAKALSAPLLTDPDLAGINEANAALTGSRDQSLPLLIATPEAIREAQDRAIALVGGRSGLAELPPTDDLAGEGGESPLVLLDDLALRVAPAPACQEKIRYSAVWAGRLPDRLPVYPRGAVIEALGQDEAGCALRAVRFVSPVPAEDILRFFATLAAREQIEVAYSANDKQWRIEGGKPGARLLVEVRPSLLEGQEVDLVYASGSAISPR